ncbi:MAG: putative repeat protein, partial [Proteobacteria bacterium]|nr:putative repeat protein [Pseudomonadota bacterium]
QLVVCQNDKEHQHFAGQDCAACARNAFMAKVVSAQELMAGSQQQATVAKASKVATPASAPVPPPKPAHLPKHTTPASAALSAIYKTIIASIALPIMAILTFWGLLQLFSMLSDSFASSRPTQHNTKATVATLVSSTTSTTQTANSFKVGEVFKDCKDCPGMVALPSGELAKSSPQSGPPAAQVVGMSRAVPQGFALHPDRRTLASLRGGGVELSDLKTLTITRKLGIDAPASSAVIFSPDGNLVAVGHEQGEVSVWRLDGRRVARVKGHMDRVVALAFSPDGKRLATGGYDGSVQVWPTTTWNRITTIDGVVTPNSQAVLGVQFSSDGQFLYVLETLYDNDERINPRTRVLSAWKTATWTEVGRLSWRLKYMDYKGNPNPLDVPFTISNWGSPQLFVASDDGHGYPKKVVPPTASKLRSITVGGCFPEIADPEALPPSDSWATAMTAYSQKGWLAAAYLKGESYEYSPGIALIPLGKGQAGRNWQTSKQSIQLAFDGGERLYSLSTDGQIIAWNLDSLPSLPTEKTSQISEATDRCSANTPVPVTQIASTKKRKALSQVAKWQLDPELKKTLLSWQSDFPSRLELVGEKLTLWGPRGRITLDAKTGSVIERDVPLANDSILISGASSERYVVRADSLLVVDKATGAQRLVEQNPGWRLMAASVAGDYVATSWEKSSAPPPQPVEFHILSMKNGEKRVIQPVPFVSMNHGVFATIYSPLSFMLTSDGSWLGYQVDGEFGYWVLLDTKTGKDFKLMKPLQSFEGPRLLEHDTRWMGLRVFNVETAQYEVLMRPHPSRIPSDNARRPHKQRFLQGAISAGARYALSGAFDGSVKLWDVVARAEVAGTGKTGSAILANGFDRANENRFFSLHWDGTFTLWQIKGSSQ